MTAANYSEAGLQKVVGGGEAHRGPVLPSRRGSVGGLRGGRGGGSTVLCAPFLWEEAIKQ